MSKQDSERAVAAKGWRWMPGMRDTEGYRVVSVHDPGGPWFAQEEDPSLADYGDGSEMPDLDDPATLGAVVLGLLPELWDDPWFAIVADIDGRWRCTGSKDYPGLYGYDSKVACAVAALEAAL